MPKKKLLSLLKPYRRRLWLEAFLKTLLAGLALGAAVAAIVLLVTKLTMENPQYWTPLLVGGASGFVFACLYYIFKFRPRWKDTTARIDELGLKERVTTMIDLSDDESTVSQIQREDALDKLRQIRPGQLKIKLPSRQIMAFVLSLIMLGAVITLPLSNVTAENASEITAEQNKIISELVAELKEKIAGLDVTDDIRAKLNAVIADLENGLPICKTYVEKIARISKASDQINAILKSLLTKNIIGAALAKYEITAALGKAILNGDIESVKAACEELKSRFAALSGDDYANLLIELIDSLNSALELSKGAGVEESDGLYAAISTFRSDLIGVQENGQQGSDVTEQFNAAIDKVRDAIIAALTVQNAIEAVLDEINELIDEAKEQMAALEAGEEPETEDSASEQSEEETGESPLSSEPALSEPSEETESGTPPESQSEPPDGAMTGEPPDGAASEIPQDEPEKIYDPEDGAVPYADVYDEYYADALAGMDKDDTASEQRSVVEDYFSSLN
jgi:hypothetical protein